MYSSFIWHKLNKYIFQVFYVLISMITSYSSWKSKLRDQVKKLFKKYITIFPRINQNVDLLKSIFIYSLNTWSGLH